MCAQPSRWCKPLVALHHVAKLGHKLGLGVFAGRDRPNLFALSEGRDFRNSAEHLRCCCDLTGFRLRVNDDLDQRLDDKFAQGRPAWDKVGAQLVEDVRPYETAKLRMLNGAHSMLAYVGLAHGQRADMLAADQLGQVAMLLLG